MGKGMTKQPSSIGLHDEYATAYDEQCREYNWRGPEVLFGLAWEYLTAGESLLDIGIGTGLSAEPFTKAGLKVTGLDGAAGMVKLCREKKIADELIQHDISVLPWPLPTDGFNHVLACGVLHFFSELEPLAAEVSRLVKPGGTFCFNFLPLNGSDQPFEAQRAPEGIDVYFHSPESIQAILEANKLITTKTVRFLMRGWGNGAEDMVVAAHVAQSIG